MLVNIFVLTFSFLFLYFLFLLQYILYACVQSSRRLVYLFVVCFVVSKKGYRVQKFVVLIFYNFVLIFDFICFDICFYLF